MEECLSQRRGGRKGSEEKREVDEMEKNIGWKVEECLSQRRGGRKGKEEQEGKKEGRQGGKKKEDTNQIS